MESQHLAYVRREREQDAGTDERGSCGIAPCANRTAIKMVRYPCLIIGVLSPSTEGYDRGEKFRRYRQLESLQEYVVVECDRKGIDCYCRRDRGTWELSPYTPDDRSETPADDLEIHLNRFLKAGRSLQNHH